MAYRLIYTNFWNDPKVLEELTPEDKLFFLYLLTNPNTNMIGIYKITKKQMAFELGYSIESINSLMDRFERHHKFIHYNADTRELVIDNWGKHNLNKGGKPVIDCIKKDLECVEDKSLINYMVKGVKSPLIRQLFEECLSKNKNDSLTSRDTSRTTTGGQYLIPNTKYQIPIPNTATTTDSSSEGKNSSGSYSNIYVFKHYEKCNFIISSMLMEKLAADIEIYGANEVIKAAEIADENGKHTYSYAKGVMEKRRANIGSDGQNKNFTKSFKKESTFNDYEQRKYDGSDGGMTMSELEKGLLGN